jgi:hypothetical protein
MKTSSVFRAAVAMILVFNAAAFGAEAATPGKVKVQIAILLDTSNSMDGLIDQAKSQLWRIVNEFATARGSDGKAPDIEVALYHYGTPSLGVETGYIRQLVPLTPNLDKVSEQLFGLRTNGGDEYCGAVIKAATDQLAWSGNKDDYKAIFIAGNEPFTQGSVDFRDSCKAAIAKGIVVNTIFCGPNDEGIKTSWKDGADLSDGSYFSINQNQQVVNVVTPFDKELVELSGKMNTTYVAYGSAGQSGQARQAAQESNVASAAPGTAVMRSVTKSTSFYRNSEWDLVDAAKEKKVDLDKVEDKDLPEEMQKMSKEERKAYVEKKTQERAAIQSKIAELNKQRDAYVKAEQDKKITAGATNTLDAAIISAIRSQAGKANIKF